MESAEPGVFGRYERGSEEFSRVLAFSDGLFAIAMTLLVVGITVPAATSSVHDLAAALHDRTPEFTSFFISFAVIGRYWAAHHQFVAMLNRMDSRFVGLNLLYLAFIAFLPFPTALLGKSFDNPLSIVIYAIAVAIVSGMEVVLFRHAQRHELLRLTLPEDVYRFGVTASLSPVLFFVASVPVAFVSTTLAVIIWFGAIPFNAALSRRKPPDSERYLGV